MEDFNDVLDNILEIKKENITYVAIILDRSGSMASIKNEVIDGFNDQLSLFVENNKKTPIKLTVITFNEYVELLLEDVEPTSDVQGLDDKSYVPHGMTALCDAIGYIVSKYKEIAETDKNASFLVNIITDGDENASKKYTKSKIKNMIKELTDTGIWTFSYLGANQDLFNVADTFYIPVSNTKAFDASSTGITAAYNTQSSSYDSYFTARSQGVRSVVDFYKE